jgi:hypothetical protein
MSCFSSVIDLGEATIILFLHFPGAGFP